MFNVYLFLPIIQIPWVRVKNFNNEELIKKIKISKWR